MNNESLLGGFMRAFFGILLGVFLQQTSDRWSVLPFLDRIHHLIPLTLVMFMLAVPEMGWADALVDMVAILVVFPFAVMLAQGARIGPVWTRIYSFAGAISYAVYLLHVPLYQLTQKFLSQLPGLSAALLFLVVVAVVSYFADVLYDIPVRRFLTARIKAGKEPPVQ
jgi:peptidoglycan/LPS O-acetylase OafA/YrhL